MCKIGFYNAIDNIVEGYYIETSMFINRVWWSCVMLLVNLIMYGWK